MAKDKRKVVRLFLSHAPQRYFLLLQFGILLGTLVFLMSLIMSTVTNVMEPSCATLAAGAKARVFDQVIYSLFLKTSILFILVFLLSALLGLFFLERLTGPLIRIQKALEEIGSGRIPDSDIYLRKQDFPIDLANALSGAIAYLRRKKAGV